MKRRHKVILSVLVIIGLTAASLGLGGTGGCSGCKQATSELDGGGDHYFPNQSEDIDNN